MPDNAKSPPEPSMEEIIASISRIITEDKKPDEPVRPTPATEKTDILELTEVVDEDGSVRRVTPSARHPEAAAARWQYGQSDSSRSGRIRRSRSCRGYTPGPSVEPELEPAASGLCRRRHRERLPRPLPNSARCRASDAGRGSCRLEVPTARSKTSFASMLRPLLQTWLDENLPGIVERLVREEIARVVGEAGLR